MLSYKLYTLYTMCMIPELISMSPWKNVPEYWTHQSFACKVVYPKHERTYNMCKVVCIKHRLNIMQLNRLNWVWLKQLLTTGKIPWFVPNILTGLLVVAFVLKNFCCSHQPIIVRVVTWTSLHPKPKCCSSLFRFYNLHQTHNWFICNRAFVQKSGLRVTVNLNLNWIS